MDYKKAWNRSNVLCGVAIVLIMLAGWVRSMIIVGLSAGDRLDDASAQSLSQVSRTFRVKIPTSMK